MQARKILMSAGLVVSMLGGAGLVASLPVSAQTPGTNATPPATGAPPAAKADDNAAEFDRLDKNHDGFLDKTESIMEPRVLANFADVDTNKDGKIDKNEWAAFQKNKALVLKK